MTPELRLLRSFVVIVEEGSLSRAANRLHIAQQSLSQQLRLLETQYGAPLLERTSRGVRMTPVGAVLLPEARALLAEADRVTGLMRRAVAGELGDLRVGFLSSVANYLMPPVVRAFHSRHPEWTLQAQEVPIAKLVGGLRAGRLDAGLTRPPLVEGLATESLFKEPVAAVLPEGHRLASRSELQLSELADEPWLLTERSSWPPWHEEYDKTFARAGFVPRIVQRGTSPQNLLALVAAGLGVTRLPVSSRSLRDGGVVFVPLIGDETEVVLARRDGRSTPAVELFAELVREVVRDLDPLALS